MKYDELNDSELINMVYEESEDAKEYLLQKYKYIIDIAIKKYSRIAKVLGYDHNDLIQDALLGFSDALNSYRDDRDTALSSFITLCVNRRLHTSILKVGRKKNKLLSSSLSLEHVYEQYATPLKDLISDNQENDPLENILKEENLKELINDIENSLSKTEYEVYSLMLNGLKYNEIATLLDKNAKQVDNTIQRIKTKIKKILEERYKS